MVFYNFLILRASGLCIGNQTAMHISKTVVRQKIRIQYFWMLMDFELSFLLEPDASQTLKINFSGYAKHHNKNLQCSELSLDEKFILL